MSVTDTKSSVIVGDALASPLTEEEVQGVLTL